MTLFSIRSDVVDVMSTINYWIVCITEDNLKIALAKGLIGFVASKASLVSAFRPGDLLTFYIPRESLSSNKYVRRIIGTAEVVSDRFSSKDPLWENGIFPERVRIKVLSGDSCDIRPIIRRLDFIKNKIHWGASLLTGIRKITEHDFRVIQNQMRQNSFRVTNCDP
jgi:predicted RNA-binding protein